MIGFTYCPQKCVPVCATSVPLYKKSAIKRTINANSPFNKTLKYQHVQMDTYIYQLIDIELVRKRSAVQFRSSAP